MLSSVCGVVRSNHSTFWEKAVSPSDGYLADSTVSFATFALPDAPAMPTLSTSNAAGAQGTYSLEITDQATLAFIDAQGGLGGTSHQAVLA